MSEQQDLRHREEVSDTAVHNTETTHTQRVRTAGPEAHGAEVSDTTVHNTETQYVHNVSDSNTQ